MVSETMGICGSTPGADTKSYAPPKAGPQPKPHKGPSKKSKSMSSDADFQLLEMIGKGAYGEVYKAEDKRTHETVAIKRIARSDIDRFVVEEVQNLSKCRHHQIIQFKEVSTLEPRSASLLSLSNPRGQADQRSVCRARSFIFSCIASLQSAF